MENEISILIAEDCEDDLILLRRGFAKAGISNHVQEVRSGRETVQYLGGIGKYQEREEYPFPGILLLDLNMPDGDGFEVLRWVRRKIPVGELLVVVLSSVQEQETVDEAYLLGAHSFLPKTNDLRDFQNVIEIFKRYWLLENRCPESCHRAVAEKQIWASEPGIIM